MTWYRPAPFLLNEYLANHPAISSLRQAVQPLGHPFTDADSPGSFCGAGQPDSVALHGGHHRAAFKGRQNRITGGFAPAAD